MFHPNEFIVDDIKNNANDNDMLLTTLLVLSCVDVRLCLNYAHLGYNQNIDSTTL